MVAVTGTPNWGALPLVNSKMEPTNHEKTMHIILIHNMEKKKIRLPVDAIANTMEVASKRGDGTLIGGCVVSSASVCTGADGSGASATGSSSLDNVVSLSFLPFEGIEYSMLRWRQKGDMLCPPAIMCSCPPHCCRRVSKAWGGAKANPLPTKTGIHSVTKITIRAFIVLKGLQGRVTACGGPFDGLMAVRCQFRGC